MTDYHAKVKAMIKGMCSLHLYAPRKMEEDSTTPILDVRKLCLAEESGLVKRSAS
jgi:hypothetical protein